MIAPDVKVWTIRAVVAAAVSIVLGFVAWLAGTTTPKVWVARLKANRETADVARDALMKSLEARTAIEGAQSAAKHATEQSATLNAYVAELDAKAKAIADYLTKTVKTDDEVARDFNDRIHSRNLTSESFH